MAVGRTWPLVPPVGKQLQLGFGKLLLAGAQLVMSVHPKYQQLFFDSPLPREPLIAKPVDPQVVNRLNQMPEFVRAYEPDGMSAEQFISYGVTQRTLSQFYESGWARLEKM